MNCKHSVIFIWAMLLACSLYSCRAKEEPQPVTAKTPLTIFHAFELTAPLQGITTLFEKEHPNFTVKAQSDNSTELARRIAQKGEKPDLFISSDYALIESLLLPKRATWYLKFARNYLTIAFTENSKFANQINSFNWYEFLVKPEVRVGYCNPNADPLGYRSLMGMKLSERYYDKKGLYEELRKNCPDKNIRPGVEALLKDLESGQLDYVWLYRSMAKQRGLKFIVLAPEIDLSSGSFADIYKQATIEVSGEVPGSKTTIAGEPIVYALTIPSQATAQQAAIAYIKLMLSPSGQEIFKKNAQMLIFPCDASDLTKIPAELIDLCKKPKPPEQESQPPAQK